MLMPSRHCIFCSLSHGLNIFQEGKSGGKYTLKMETNAECFKVCLLSALLPKILMNLLKLSLYWMILFWSILGRRGERECWSKTWIEVWKPYIREKEWSRKVKFFNEDRWREYADLKARGKSCNACRDRVVLNDLNLFPLRYVGQPLVDSQLSLSDLVWSFDILWHLVITILCVICKKRMHLLTVWKILFCLSTFHSHEIT